MMARSTTASFYHKNTKSGKSLAYGGDLPLGIAVNISLQISDD
jgi:hypothetical protein